jgi:SAM-dependent methyltransferase
MHGNSLAVLKRFGLSYFRAGMAVLEVGPDPQKLTRALVEPLQVRYHYADRTNVALEDPGAVPMTGPYRFDCPDGLFDLVYSANVAEHVPRLWSWVRELARVTKPGGHLLFVSPVSWPYHEAPVDCWRILPEGYQALFEEAGLEHAFSWHGNLVPIDPHWLTDHGPQLVTDTIAVARKPAEGAASANTASP